MLDSRALTKVQSAVLIVTVLFAAIVGGGAYTLWKAAQPAPEAIRIGVCADLDNHVGGGIWQAATLAAEQVNAEGGVLGRNFTIVAEDDDDESGGGLEVLSRAMTRLISVDNATYVISGAIGATPIFTHQDICAELKTIMFGVKGANLEFTQRVLDDYDRYKYYFHVWERNSTVFAATFLENILTVRNYTGFNKVALLFVDGTATKQMMAYLNSTLSASGFEIVYSKLYSARVTDFTSYFAAVEESGAEIFAPLIMGGCVPFVKEWYDRQSPLILCGSFGDAEDPGFWELTEGKCEGVCFMGIPMIAGYPWTSKTLPMWDAYLERWGSLPVESNVVAAYDCVRFILPDAIRRAGTTETEAVIKALESTNVETSMARNFVFTTSHDILFSTLAPQEHDEDHVMICMFQWQANATQAIVGPEHLMQEIGNSYQYPSWEGPWSKQSLTETD